MVKLKGPGFGLAASGSLGNAVTYSSSKGRAYIKRKPTPKQPRTGPQLSMRAMMKFLSKEWSNLNEARKTELAALADPPKLNAYNGWIKYNLDRWRNKLPPTNFFPPDPTKPEPQGIGLVATAQLTHVYLDAYNLAPPNSGYTGLLFYSPIGSPSPDWEKLIHVFRLWQEVHDYWSHGPLPPGSHYYKVYCAPNGGLCTWTKFAIRTAVIS